MFAIRQLLISALALRGRATGCRPRRFRHRPICRRNREVDPGEFRRHVQF